LMVGVSMFYLSHPSGKSGPQSGAPDGNSKSASSRTTAGSFTPPHQQSWRGPRFVAKGAPQDDGDRRSSSVVAGANSGNKKSQVKAHTKTPAAAKPDFALAQFMELPFSDASLPLEDATVVRVQLPASALRQAGVPV